MSNVERRDLWSVTLACVALAAAVSLLALVVNMASPAEPRMVRPTVTTTYTMTPAPAPTVTVTATPKPAPTVTVTKIREVSRSQPRKAVTARPGVEAFLACVVKHESGGNPRAQNPTSSASGLFQFIDSSWRAYAKAAGVVVYSRAKDAPASVQWQVARHTVINFGHYPWKGTHCGYGT